MFETSDIVSTLCSLFLLNHTNVCLRSLLIEKVGRGFLSFFFRNEEPTLLKPKRFTKFIFM